MSVHLSHVEFSPQFTDEDEAELEREDEEQQQKLKEFLDHELDDDDIFEVSFASYRSQGNHFSDKSSHPPQKKTNGDAHILGMSENRTDAYQNIHYDTHPVSSINGMQNDQNNYVYSNGYRSSSNNRKHTNTHSPPQGFYNISNHYNVADDAYGNSMMHNDGYQVDGKQYIEDSQLCVLYNARGKKIESLEVQIEETKEKFSKDIRVLQHKLTMMTSEKDGLASSFQQHQSLLQEHKQQISMLEKQLSIEQEEKRHLNNQITELNEKLYASDCAVDTLQEQIKQINQTESMARARSQHENMLATTRQRHEEEILCLKEKLDDLQQALAWKTEDLNRYREMLDSNSSVSEIGILRNRLAQEEEKTKDLQGELEKSHKKYIESEEQLKLYEGLVKMQAAHLTSTPLNAVGLIMDKEEFDFKTPVNKARSQDMVDTGGMGPTDSSFREELVKSLSINREKRQQINVLRDQLEYFQKQLHGKKTPFVQDRDTQTDTIYPTDTQTDEVVPCDQCETIQCALDEKIKELEHLSLTSQNEINQLQSDKMELKANMSDMVKNFDKQKVSDLQSQNKAALQLVDDVKANLLKEVQKIHEEEKQHLHSEIESLNGELLHTKEEYLKLCTEVKDLEDQMRKEFDVERKSELNELKQKLEIEYNNQLSKQEINLINKYVEDLENEKCKWQEDNEKENADKIECSVMLAKADWIENYNAKRGENLKEKENSELNTMKEKCEKLEEESKELEIKCSQQQEDFHIQLEAAKLTWHNEQNTEFSVKIEELHQNKLSEEKEKMEANLQKVMMECDDKCEKEVTKLQTDLSEQTSFLRKVELNYKLKTALWNRTENEMKRKLESLEKASNKHIQQCEKCQQEAKGSVCKNSDAVQEKEMCTQCCIVFKFQESIWQSREKDLLTLLEEAQEQIRVRLGNLKNLSFDATNNNAITAVNMSLSLEGTKESEYREKIENMAAEVKQWKDQYDESEKRITELNHNIQSIKEDMVYSESCYKRQLDTLHKELENVQGTLAKTQNDLSIEREKTNKVILESKNIKSTLSDTENKCSLMNSTQKLNDSKHTEEIEKLTEEMNNWKQRYDVVEKKKTELDRNIMISKGDKLTLENNYRMQFEASQNEITNLKQTLSNIENKLADEKEKSNKLEVDCKKLSDASIADNRLTSLIGSKQKIVESEYEKKVEDFTAECNKWKLKYHDVEKENVELERNIQLQLANVTNTESYFKKQLETLQQEIAQLKETLSHVQNDFYVEKDRSNKLDLECKQLTKNYSMNLENVLNVEKQKWQIESAKLQEAVLKASEIDHNNFVKEIQNQTNHINEINKIKEEHDILVRNLKHGFREKLARITEMKKKWIKEEEEKRSHIEKKVKEKYVCKFAEIQEQHENILRDQQSHWIKEIHQSKKEQLSTLVGLREEVKMKDKLLLKERKTFEEGESLGKYKIKELITQHHQEIEKLKIEHLNNLQREKRRLEQYYKIMNENPVSMRTSTKEASQNFKETKEVEKTGSVAEPIAEKEKHPLNNTQEEFDGCGKTRQFYVETLEKIQQDVLHHIATMRTNADIEIREAVERERKKIYQELKMRERSITTSSPRIEKDEEFRSPTLTNSLEYGSCMAFRDLPHVN